LLPIYDHWPAAAAFIILTELSLQVLHDTCSKFNGTTIDETPAYTLNVARNDMERSVWSE